MQGRREVVHSISSLIYYWPRSPEVLQKTIFRPSETEAKPVEKGHGHVMRSASQLDTASAAVLAVEQALEAVPGRG
jgi:hypothetical protein